MKDLFNPTFLYGRFQPVCFSSTKHSPSENDFAGLFPAERPNWVSRQTLWGTECFDCAKSLERSLRSVTGFLQFYLYKRNARNSGFRKIFQKYFHTPTENSVGVIVLNGTDLGGFLRLRNATPLGIGRSLSASDQEAIKLTRPSSRYQRVYDVLQ